MRRTQKLNHRPTRNTRLAFEQLEGRRLLAVDASIINGDLVITGNAEGTVSVNALEDGSIEVREGENVVANLTGFNDDILIKLDADGTTNDSVVLNLNQASVDRVMVDLGGGDNELIIESGTINGSVLFRGGDGDDSLSIGESVDVLHSVYAWLGDGDNSVEVDGSIQRNLSVRTGNGDDSVQLSDTSSVGRQVSLDLGNGSNLATLAGEIGSSLSYRGGDGDDIVTIEESGVVLGDARIQLGGGSNEVNHMGEIEGNLLATSSNSEDTLNVDSSAIVGGRTTELFGSLPRRGYGFQSRHFFH